MTDTMLSTLHASAKTAVPTGAGVLISVPGSGGRVFDELTPSALAGVPGPAGQGFSFRGPWAANTAYAPYDVVTYLGQTFVSSTSFTSSGSFVGSNWSLMAAQGAQGIQGLTGQQGPTGASGPGTGTVNTGTTGQLAAYLAGGTTLSGISLGAGLALSSNTLSATGATPASTAPIVDGPAAIGTSAAYARADHVHPTDASREAIANKGAVNGYAGLDATGKVPAAQLPTVTGGTSAFGTPQTITAAGTQAIDITKALVILNNTAGVTNLTLAAGTTDGQEFELAILPTTQLHTLAGTFFGTASTLQPNSPNIGVALVFKWSSTQSSWFPRAYDGGYKASDFGPAGALALSDLFVVERAGTGLSSTLTAAAALVRKTPAGSRTIALATGSTVATLTSTDNDKTVVVNGIAGSLTVDGTITDGFRCHVINHTGAALTLTSITGLSGGTSIANNTASTITLANSATEATIASTGTSYTLPPATTTVLGGVKSDGNTVSIAGDGTLSVVIASTGALPAATTVSGGDKFSGYAVSGSDFAYTLTQISAFGQSNYQSWTTAGRPTLTSSQYGQGYNTTLGRFDFWNGTAWNQHARVSGDTFAGAVGSAAVALTDGASIATNAALSNLFTVTLAGNRALANPTNLVAGFYYTWQVTQDATGTRTLTYGNLFSWKGGTAPTLSTAANAVDVIVGYYDGTKLRCSFGSAFA